MGNRERVRKSERVCTNRERVVYNHRGFVDGEWHRKCVYHIIIILNASLCCNTSLLYFINLNNVVSQTDYLNRAIIAQFSYNLVRGLRKVNDFQNLSEIYTQSYCGE